MDKGQIIKQYFGYDTFRDGQGELIDCILAGGDCLGVMPTGAGKSICFQVPALMLEGVTLVVSPLISLMTDQVNALNQSGVRAAYINSSLTERQTYTALENAWRGVYKIIYIAPERLESEHFLQFAFNTSIAMLTVDEAHCISQWGQDFRPSYLKISSFLESLPQRPVVSAFTATATPEVRYDIIHMLKLAKPMVLVTGFDRKNLHFSVKKPDNKFTALDHFLHDKKDKSGLIYCNTRKTVEEVCTRLKGAGYSVTRYHAGLGDKERRDNQDDFIYDRAQLMVATNAFGMGIDKSNVNFVVHYNMPKNMESYYQEAGRAGRDGEAACCILLYSPMDVRINSFLIENTEAEEGLKERDRKRLKEMTFYCHSSYCLRGYILKYFGERGPGYCGNCSNCLSQFELYDVTIETQKILSCVVKSRQRFGMKMIISILRGGGGKRIKQLGLDKLSTYKISSLSENRLREIIHHLILNEYLLITDDQYPVLKLGQKAGEVLRENRAVEMRLAKEKTPAPQVAPTKKETTPNQALFKILRTLRMEIANEQSVPAFVIFPDSALTDMCAKMPTTPEEMLKVSGVGKTKLDRYGSRFLEAIALFNEECAKDE